jgi:hypothetical protein
VSVYDLEKPGGHGQARRSQHSILHTSTKLDRGSRITLFDEGSAMLFCVRRRPIIAALIGRLSAPIQYL